MGEIWVRHANMCPHVLGTKVGGASSSDGFISAWWSIKSSGTTSPVTMTTTRLLRTGSEVRSCRVSGCPVPSQYFLLIPSGNLVTSSSIQLSGLSSPSHLLMHLVFWCWSKYSKCDVSVNQTLQNKSSKELRLDWSRLSKPEYCICKCVSVWLILTCWSNVTVYIIRELSEFIHIPETTPTICS